MDPDEPEGAGPLVVSVRSLANGVVVRLDGELDHDTAAPLRVALDDALRTAPAWVVVDCSGLEFCDATGLTLLRRARLAAEAGGGEVVLAALRPMVARMLEITGAGEAFRVFAAVEDAISAQDGR